MTMPKSGSYFRIITCFSPPPPLATRESTSCLESVTDFTPPTSPERSSSLTSSVIDLPWQVATSCTPRWEIVLAESHSCDVEISSTMTVSGERFSTARRMKACWFFGSSTGTQRHGPMAGCASLVAPAISLVLSTTTTVRSSWSDSRRANSRSTVVLPEFGGPTKRMDSRASLRLGGSILSTMPVMVRPTRMTTPMSSPWRPLTPLRRCSVFGMPRRLPLTCHQPVSKPSMSAPPAKSLRSASSTRWLRISALSCASSGSRMNSFLFVPSGLVKCASARRPSWNSSSFKCLRSPVIGTWSMKEASPVDGRPKSLAAKRWKSIFTRPLMFDSHIIFRSTRNSWSLRCSTFWSTCGGCQCCVFAGSAFSSGGGAGAPPLRPPPAPPKTLPPPTPPTRGW
mmetsp:Transcript_92435/g.258327  ORF Transcript_92435/g.258327 Transcript_92435/m.258327 type:complete len:397 (+) Transcript_92435:453-1643(+)